MEALLFLHHLRSLFTLFALLTVLVTPSMASFNYFAAVQPASTDWLNMLSWSNLSTNDARSYWLYALLTPTMNAFTLWVLSRALTRAVQLRADALVSRPTRDDPHPHRGYFVAVENIPTEWDMDRVWEHYSDWRDHIIGIYEVPVQARRRERSDDMTSLTHTIEARETSFIVDVVQQARVMDDTTFSTLLRTRLRERYANPDRPTGLLARTSPSMRTLYTRLEELVTSSLGVSVASVAPARPMSILISLDSYHRARALAGYPHPNDTAHRCVHFIGSSVADLIVTNMGLTSCWIEVRRACLSYLTTMLIVVWTLPMAMVGGLSQLSVLIKLVPGLSGWEVPLGVLGVLQGVVPSVATSVLMWLFPRFLQVMVDRARHRTRIEEQLSIQRRYFCFLVVQLFLNPSIASGLVPTIFEVLTSGVLEVPRILARNLPLAGNYYLSYLLVQAMLVVVSTLVRPLAMVNLYRASRRASTPRAKVRALWGLLVPVQWGERYPLCSVLAVIGM